MKLKYGTLRDQARSFTAALVFLLCNSVAWADTYNPATKQLSIPAVSVGGATFFNAVFTITGLVRGPTGTAAMGGEDSYDTSSGQLTIPSVTVGAITYYNAVATVGDLVSLGSVSGADTFSGNLFIPHVIVGRTVYQNVTVSLGSIISVIGGAPRYPRDIYDYYTGELTIAAVQVGAKIYTNVVVTVGTVMAVGGFSPPVTLAPSAMSFDCSYSTGCQPMAMLIINTGYMPQHISGITISSQTYSIFTETNNCGASLGAGESCAASVRYASGALNVHYTGSVNVAHDPGSPQILSMSLAGFFHY